MFVKNSRETYEEWKEERFGEDASLEDYVVCHLRRWVSTKEELLGEKQERAEEEKRAAENRRRSESEEQLKGIMPRLRCPLCRKGGKITNYVIVKGEFGLEVYLKCDDCSLYYQPKWVVHPFGTDEVDLYPVPFARIPSDRWDNRTSQSVFGQ